jgi:protein phosphatase
VDARADVYAVGALLYHLVNGAPLPESGPELATWSPPAPLGGVPQILRRCLGGLETRYRTMEALHRDLLALARRTAGGVRYSLAAATDIGLEPERTTNQDAYVYLTGQLESEEGAQSWAALAVCDGMGGMEAGEVASAAAVKALAAQAAALATRRGLAGGEQVELVKGWMQAANEAACAALDRRDAQGGATLVGAAVLGRRLAIAHVGDCRLYRLRGETIEPLTRDHSLVMALALQGEIAMDAIRHHPDRSTVTRSLGDRHPLPDHQIDTLEPATGNPVLELEPGDLLLFCSDGLWEPVVEAEMIAAIGAHGPDLVAAAEALVDLALQRGGPDNVTVLLFRVDG